MFTIQKLSVPRPLFFMDQDGAGGAGSSSPTDSGQEKTAKNFTQDEVNAIAGKARADGRESHEKEILAKLGLTSFDDVAKIIQTAKEFEDKQKTEFEKIQERAEKAQAALETEKAERAKDREGFTKRLLDAEIVTLASKAINDEKGKKVVRPAFRSAALDDVLLLIDRSQITQDEAGKFTGIDKALSALATQKDYLLDAPATSQKGTPEDKGRRNELPEQPRNARPSTL